MNCIVRVGVLFGWSMLARHDGLTGMSLHAVWEALNFVLLASSVDAEAATLDEWQEMSPELCGACCAGIYYNAVEGTRADLSVDALAFSMGCSNQKYLPSRFATSKFASPLLPIWVRDAHFQTNNTTNTARLELHLR